MRRILAIAVLVLAVDTGSAEPDKRWSFRDFTGVDFSTYPAKEFNGNEIKGSCFYQEALYDENSLTSAKDPKKSIFPAGMIGVTFIRCNLDNVAIPPGNTVDAMTTNRKIRVMNDGQDWVLDTLPSNIPLEPVNKEQLIEEGKNVDPLRIPVMRISP